MASADHFRALTRRPVSLPATLIGVDDNWIEEASVLDLGLGGAGLLLRRTLFVGATVRVRLICSNLWDPLVISAQVRWNQATDARGVSRVGLQFEPTSGHQIRALADLIASTAYE